MLLIIVFLSGKKANKFLKSPNILLIEIYLGPLLYMALCYRMKFRRHVRVESYPLTKCKRGGAAFHASLTAGNGKNDTCG